MSGGGKAYTVAEFARIVAKVFGKNIDPDITAMYRYGDTRNIFSDISRLRELGWTPRYTPNESVEEYANWLRTLDDLENILEEAEQKMRSLGVIRDSEKNATNERKSYESISPRRRSRIKVAAVNR